MKVKLRKHQKKQNKAVRKALKRDDHVLYGAPTGFGKSVCIYDFVNRTIGDGGRVLVIAPRRKLIFQLASLFNSFNIAIMMGSSSMGVPSQAGLIIASRQTLSARLKKDEGVIGDLDLIIIDEVHEGFNMPEGKIPAGIQHLHDRYWGSAQWLGFSATPITASGKKLQGWDATSYLYDTAWLIRKGWLAQFDYYTTQDIDTSEMRVTSTGDYAADEMEAAAIDIVAVEAVYTNYKKYCSGRKTLIFAASIVHAELIKESLASHNLEGHAVLHSQLSDMEIEKIYRDFDAGYVHTLINVGILTTGFDDPSIEALLIARPTASKRLAIQIWGRALRAHKDIPKVRIIDLCNISGTLNLVPDKKMIWDAEGRKFTGDVENSIADIVAQCPHCSCTFRMVDAKRSVQMSEDYIEVSQICPECEQVVSVKTKVLSNPDKVRKIKTMADVDYSTTYSLKEIYNMLGELIKTNTRKGKTSWGHYIYRTCMKKNQPAFREAMYAYAQEVVNSKKTWNTVMDLYNA